MGLSLQMQLASLPDEDQRHNAIEAMSPAERELLASWGGQARPEQLQPDGGDWTYWAAIGGRGSGKTRLSAEWVCDRIQGIDSRTRQRVAFRAKYIGFIGRSAGDVRRVMVEGPSGFIVCAERRGMAVIYNPSRAQITVTDVDGHKAVITLFSAEEPDSLRGPEHDTVWADEFAAWPRKMDSVGNTAFTNVQAGLRVGEHPRGVFSTTPKVTLDIKSIWNDDTGDWIRTAMTTWDNEVNLAASFIAVLRRQYPAGSRLAQQEFEGLLLEEVEGALWSLKTIDQTRIDSRRPCPMLVQRAVAVDPSVQWRGEGSECGIIGGGLTDRQQFVVTVDRSVSGGPEKWAEEVVRACVELDTKTVIAEGNNGGALVKTVIENLDPTLNVHIVFARDGKRARAEPVAFLWDQKRAGIYGSLPGLEGQMTGWSSYESESPDRIDALAWLGHWAMQRMFYLPPGWASSAGRSVNSAVGGEQLVVAAAMPGITNEEAPKEPAKVVRLSRKERLAMLEARGAARRARKQVRGLQRAS